MDEDDIHQHGKAVVVFLDGLMNPIEGIVYRLVAGNQVIMGISDAQGQAKPLTISNTEPNPMMLGWVVSDESVNVDIEVQRDNGTLKKIGAFLLEPEKSKRITAAIDSIRVPVYLTREQ